MGDYRDEKQAALQRAEALAQENVRLQAELAALKQGKKPAPARPTPSRGPRTAALLVGATTMVAAGMGAGFWTLTRRPAVDMQSSQSLRGAWTAPAPIARMVLRAAARAEGGTWVVGNAGAIYFQAAGTTVWTAVPSGTQADLHGITAGPPLMVVGARGTVLRFEPTERRWIAETTHSTEDLYAVAVRRFGAGRASVVAVGADGTMLMRMPEGTWMPALHPTRSTLYGVTSAEGDFSLVAVGAGGVIVGVPSGGEPLRVQASPVTTTLRAVASHSGTVLAVGDGGVMVTTSAMAPWTVVPSGSTDDLFAVLATLIPFDERGPGSVSSGAPMGFLAAGARGTVLVERLGSSLGWRSVRSGGADIRAVTDDPWGFFAADGTAFGFSTRSHGQ